MRVRIEREVAKKVAAAARKTKRTHAAEVSMTLAAYYERQAIKEFLSQPSEENLLEYRKVMDAFHPVPPIKP